MSKYNRYEEPEMPESLVKLLTDDFSDSDPRREQRKRNSNGNRKKSANSKKKKPVSQNRKKQATSKKVSGKSTRPQKIAKPAKPAAAKKARPKSSVEGPKKSRQKSSAAPRKTRPIPQEATRKLPVIKDEPRKAGEKAKKKRLYEDEKTKRIAISSTKQTARKPVKNKAAKAEPRKKAVQKRKRKKRKAELKHIVSAIIYGILLVIGFIFTGGDKKKYISKEERKRLDFKFHKILSISVIAILVVVMIAIGVTPKQKISVAENRDLQQKPKFTISSYISGKYAKDFSKYLSDQFPDRQGLIKDKAKFDLAMGRKEVNGVYICKDGYLMEGFTEAAPEVTDAKVEAINKFVSQNPKLNVSMMIVPNKVEIYNNLFPKNAPVASQKEYLDYLKKKVDKKVNFVNLINTFDKLKNSTQLYYKTDHHWTSDGAYNAYVEYAKSKDIDPAQEKSYLKSLATNSFLGSLYYKNGAQIGKPEDIVLYLKDKPYPLLVKYYDTKNKTTTLYDADKLDGKDKYEVFTGGNHSQIKIRTNVKTKRKLLLIKDSYANSMLPFLINDFAEINVVDLRYYTGTMADILNNNEITDVLILYNVNTFNSDSSILNIFDPNYHAEDTNSSDDSSSLNKDKNSSNKTSDKKNSGQNSTKKSASSDKDKAGSASDKGKKSDNKKK